MLRKKKFPFVNISRCHSSTFESRQSLLNFEQSYVGEQRSFPPQHCEQSSYGPITSVNAVDFELFIYRRLPALPVSIVETSCSSHLRPWETCCTGVPFSFVLENWEFSARQWLGPVAQCCYWSSARTCFVRNQLYSVEITPIIPGNITPSEPIWEVVSIRVMLILKQSEQQYTLIGKLPTLKCRLGMSWPILWRFHDLIMKMYTLAPSPY